MKSLFGMALGLGIGVGLFIAAASCGAYMGAIGYKAYDDRQKEEWDTKFGSAKDDWIQACGNAAN